MTPDYDTILETYVTNYQQWQTEPDVPSWIKHADETKLREYAAKALHHIATHGRQDPYGPMSPILTKTGKSLGLKTGKAFRLHIKSLPEFEAIAASEATVRTQPREGKA